MHRNSIGPEKRPRTGCHFGASDRNDGAALQQCKPMRTVRITLISLDAALQTPRRFKDGEDVPGN